MLLWMVPIVLFVISVCGGLLDKKEDYFDFWVMVNTLNVFLLPTIIIASTLFHTHHDKWTKPIEKLSDGHNTIFLVAGGKGYIWGNDYDDEIQYGPKQALAKRCADNYSVLVPWDNWGCHYVLTTPDTNLISDWK